MTNNVLVIAGVAYDHILHVESLDLSKAETVFCQNAYYTLGGTGSGKALNLNNLGFDVTLQCRVGNDWQGEKVLDALKSHDINLIVDRDESGTECHTNLMGPSGHRKSFFTQMGEFEPDIALSSIESDIQAADAVHLNIVNYARYFIPLIQAYKKPTWVDLHDYDGENPYYQDFIHAAHVIMLSSQNLPNYRQFMEAQIDQGKQLVICTHGKEGATCLSATGQWVEQPIDHRFKLVDANGAGDAFLSGFHFGQNAGWSIEKSMQAGSIVAGLAVETRQLSNDKLCPKLLHRYMQFS